MRRRTRTLLATWPLLFISGSAIAAGPAPFCVYGNMATQCYYYDVQSCQNAARSLGGMCVPSSALQDAQGYQRPAQGVRSADLFTAGQEGAQAGRDARFRRLAAQAFKAKTAAERDALVAEAIEADPVRGMELARFLDERGPPLDDPAPSP